MALSTSTHPHSLLSTLPKTTVRYGTRLATIAILNDNYDDYKDENPQLPDYDTCPNNTVECDAIRDCQLGTDETNCGEWVHTHTHRSTRIDLTSTRLIQGQMVKKGGQTLDSQRGYPQNEKQARGSSCCVLTHGFCNHIVRNFIYAILFKQEVQSAFQ